LWLPAIFALSFTDRPAAFLPKDSVRSAYNMIFARSISRIVRDVEFLCWSALSMLFQESLVALVSRVIYVVGILCFLFFCEGTDSVDLCWLPLSVYLSPKIVGVRAAKVFGSKTVKLEREVDAKFFDSDRQFVRH